MKDEEMAAILETFCELVGAFEELEEFCDRFTRTLAYQGEWHYPRPWLRRAVALLLSGKVEIVAWWLVSKGTDEDAEQFKSTVDTIWALAERSDGSKNPSSRLSVGYMLSSQTYDATRYARALRAKYTRPRRHPKGQNKTPSVAHGDIVSEVIESWPTARAFRDYFPWRPGHPDPVHLRSLSSQFRALAGKFEEAPRLYDRSEDLRWILCLGLGVQAGTLLGKCLDYDAFPDWAFEVSGPPWDLRYAEPGLVSFRAMIYLSKLSVPLAVLEAYDPDSTGLKRSGSARPDVMSKRQSSRREKPSPEQQTQEGRRLEELFASIAEGIEDEPPSERRKRERGDETCAILCTWLAGVRLWLIPKHPHRFRGDALDTFHPWVDRFCQHPFADPHERSPHPTDSEGLEVDRAMFLLRAHAEIQAEACRVLGDELSEAIPKIESAQNEFAEQMSPDGSRPSPPDRPSGHLAEPEAQVAEQSPIHTDDDRSCVRLSQASLGRGAELRRNGEDTQEAASKHGVLSAPPAGQVVPANLPTIKRSEFAKRVHKTKSAVEKVLKTPNAPKPLVRVSKGKAFEYDWEEMRLFGKRVWRIDIGDPPKRTISGE